MSSIRARLTATITVATAVLAVLAVWAGLRLLENDVRSSAVEREVSDLENPVSLSSLDLELVEGDIDPFGSDVFLITDTIENLEAGGVLDSIEDAFANDDTLTVLLFTERIVQVDLNQRTVTPIAFSALGEDDIVVLQSDLTELQFALTDPFEFADEILIDEAIEDAEDLAEGELADLIESELVDTPLIDADRIIETEVIEQSGPDLGLVVDVTDEVVAIQSLRPPLWTAAAILTLLAGAATWLLTQRALRPVGAITSRVEEISGGTLHDRVPETGTNDEIGVLASTMNRMLARLEAADRRQRQFVSDASHELRTPVSVLRSEADAAQRAPHTTTLGNLANVVTTEADRLGTMIDDLLYLARRDEASRSTASAGAPGASSSVDLDEIAIAEAARSRRVPVDLTGLSAGRVDGRPDELRRALGHLLDNAARHAQSSVAIAVQTEADQVVMTVDDDGSGVEPADRDQIFERFVRLDEARARDDGGSGLGLAVVKAIVEQHGGTVRVLDAPAGGARFELRFPAAR